MADPDDIDAAAWTDITADVGSWSIDRGRSTELQDIQAGEGDLTLDNAVRTAAELPGKYTPGYNPAAANKLPSSISTGGFATAGTMPDDIGLDPTGLSGITLSVVPSADAAFLHTWAYQIAVAGGASGTPELFTRTEGDLYAGPYDLAGVYRVTASAAHRFSLQHKLVSGTGQALVMDVKWLDSEGVVLSTTSSGTFTPTGTVTQTNLSATSPAGAKYAAVGIRWNAAVAAAHTVRFTALQFLEGTSTTLLDPLFYPNIRPRVPMLIWLRDSTSTYRRQLYGFCGNWDQDIDGHEVSVPLRDGMTLLAEHEIDRVADEVAKMSNLTVYAPLDDASDTRRTWRADNYAGVDDSAFVREVKGTRNAIDLSEFYFGEAGPQDGMGSIRFSPESDVEGYALVTTPPVALQPLVEGNPATFCWGGWFKQTPQQRGPVSEQRPHRLITLLHKPTNKVHGGIQLQADGSIQFQMAASAGATYAFVETDENLADGEWHHVYCEFEDIGGDQAFRVFTDGQLIFDFTELTAYTFDPTGFEVQLGGLVYRDLTGERMARASLSSWFWKAGGLLTSDELAALYAVGAPPSITGGELESERIERLLDVAGWPSTHRLIDPGLTTLVGSYPADTNVLDAIKLVAEEAGGEIFVNRAGKIVYANRQARYNPTLALQCSTSTQSMPENQITPTMGEEQIFNHIMVAREIGNAIEVEDLRSQRKYGKRTLPLDLSPLSDDDALQAANWFLHVYAEPKLRVGKVRFNPTAANSSTLWDFIATLELHERTYIDLNVVQLAGLPFFVEHIHIDCDAVEQELTFELDLSPADAYQNICEFDSATDGIFDSCRLGW